MTTLERVEEIRRWHEGGIISRWSGMDIDALFSAIDAITARAEAAERDNATLRQRLEQAAAMNEASALALAAAQKAWETQDDVVAETFLALSPSRFGENGDEPLPSRVARMRVALEAAEKQRDDAMHLLRKAAIAIETWCPSPDEPLNEINALLKGPTP